jgi:hypothetical protein
MSLFFFSLAIFLPHKFSFLWSFSHLRVIQWNQSWQGRELRTWSTRRKTCIFDYSLRLNFSHKRHFATKILLVA